MKKISIIFLVTTLIFQTGCYKKDKKKEVKVSTWIIMESSENGGWYIWKDLWNDSFRK